MSEENDPSSSSVASKDANAKQAEPTVAQKPDQQEELDDDADFVVVKNRKKHPETHHHHHHHPFHNSKQQYHRHYHHHHHRGGGQQSSHHDQENEHNITEGRRKKFRDRDNRDRDRRDHSGSRYYNRGGNRNRQQRDTPPQQSQSDQKDALQRPPSQCNKENAGDTANNRNIVIEKTAFTPAKSFSSVAAGASSPPTTTSSSLSLSSGCSAPVLVESNEQTNDHLTNRQVVVVVDDASTAVGSGAGSSIPDTASVTSENETIDSLSGTTKSSVTEGSAAASAVEYIDAPMPKMNPWVINRNAAQVISSTKKVSLSTGFPSVSESTATAFPDTLSKSQNKSTCSATAPQNKQKPSAPPRNQSESKPSSSAPVNNNPASSIKPNVTSSSINPSSTNQQSIAAPTFSSKVAQSRSTQSVESSSPPPPPPLPSASNASPHPYYREMANGFRPGRGRGSYSASASGRKVPIRSQVANKVTASGTSAPASSVDWPTLGEATAIESSSSPTAAAPEVVNKTPDNAREQETGDTKVDEVDSHKVVQSQPTAKEVPTLDSASDNGGSSSHDSDNEGDSPSGTRNGIKKQNKQKWVPLDYTAAEASERNKASSKQKKQPYPPYVRGKGKDMNGHVEYSERPMNRPSHGNQIRGMRGGGGRGGSNRGGGPRRHMTGGNNHHRTNNSNMTFNGHLLNGHVDYDLISSAQAHQGGEGFTDYPTDFTTLTPMYPAVSEFIMPYVTNGYFPTPFTPPPGVIVDAVGETHPIAPGNPSPAVTVAVVAANAAVSVPAPTFVPVNDLIMLIDLVRQIEYYFSEENLEKDFYLRRKMDEEGYLPVHLIATFPRVKNMTQDYSVVLRAIQSSENLELKQDMKNVRTRKDPRKWPIQDSGKTLSPVSVYNNNTSSSMPAMQTGSSSASSSSEKSDASSQNSINNNNIHHEHDHLHVAAEPLNPNVPEFVPKSKVASY